ncbi:hypothetical protein L208DRAFT_344760 [Tricholoma matsutake]|nr:hypothetical protein L208DRAFT_344760 [Tricholoma matsutake 945]
MATCHLYEARRGCARKRLGARCRRPEAPIREHHIPEEARHASCVQRMATRHQPAKYEGRRTAIQDCAAAWGQLPARGEFRSPDYHAVQGDAEFAVARLLGAACNHKHGEGCGVGVSAVSFKEVARTYNLSISATPFFIFNIFCYLPLATQIQSASL